MKVPHWQKFSAPVKMATFDAAPEPRIPIISSNFLDESVMNAIEKELEDHERLCILFFLIDDYSQGYEKLFDNVNNERSLAKFVNDNNVADWEDKVLEVLCLLQHHEILLNLGIKPEDARIKFSTNIREVRYAINKYAKAFYSLFESLTKKDAQRLLDRVYDNIPRPPDSRSWPEKVSLELHLLWWIRKGFVKVSENIWSLEKLLRILKELDMAEKSVLQEYNATAMDNGPCHLDNKTNSNTIRRIDTGARCNIVKKVTEYKITNGLVLIFNQMNFTGPISYEYRHGSEIDCCRILKAFRDTFGFKSEVHTDLGREQIYSELDSLRSRGEKYDCVAVFLLSHGTYGNIISSDGLECPIKTIETKLCSKVLQDKPKILVIQACQKETLTTDAPNNEEIDTGRFEDLLVLSSTILGHLSIRDRENGTWFIRVLCEVLVDMVGETVAECLTLVNSRFKDMVAKIDGQVMKQVPSYSSNLAKRLIFPRKVGLSLLDA